jgi:hypothetical protein
MSGFGCITAPFVVLVKLSVCVTAKQLQLDGLKILEISWVSAGVLLFLLVVFQSVDHNNWDKFRTGRRSPERRLRQGR